MSNNLRNSKDFKDKTNFRCL